MNQTDPPPPEQDHHATEAAAPEERVIYQANPAMFRAHPVWYIFGLLLIAGGAAGVILGLQLENQMRQTVAWSALTVMAISIIAMGWWWLQTRRTTFTVTSSRTRLRRGLLSVHMTEVWHRHVRNVQLTQTVWERIFGVGTLSIASAGKASWDIQISGLPKIYKAKDVIDEYRLAVSHGEQN